MKKKTQIISSTALSTPLSSALSWAKEKAVKLLTSTAATEFGVVTERDGNITILIEPGKPEEVELSGGRFFRVMHKHGPFILAAELLGKYHVIVKTTTPRQKAGAETDDSWSY